MLKNCVLKSKKIILFLFIKITTEKKKKMLKYMLNTLSKMSG